MKKSLLPILLLTFLTISCGFNNEPADIEKFEVINKFEETIFISSIFELETSYLIDPSPVISLEKNSTLVKLEPGESQVFFTDEITEYEPQADFCIYIYAFGVPEAEDPTKLVKLASIYTVKNKEVIWNGVKIPVSK